MLWTFDNCALDVERRELRRAGAPVAVEPQVFDLLVYLIHNRARVVSKDDLLQAVWQNRAVSDSALANRINAAHTAIGDSGEHQTLIRTLPRKGFRFVGNVAEDSAESDAARLNIGLVPSKLGPSDQPSLIVLPFTDMSPDHQQGHFADGITEDLITELARIRWLFVIGRNSAFAYKDRAIDVNRIAHELGVRYILEGSIRRSAQRLRITAQLVDRQRAYTNGPNDTTELLARYSPFRMRLRAAWLPRSNRISWRPREDVLRSSRRPISARGSSSRVRKARRCHALPGQRHDDSPRLPASPRQLASAIPIVTDAPVPQ